MNPTKVFFQQANPENVSTYRVAIVEHASGAAVSSLTYPASVAVFVDPNYELPFLFMLSTGTYRLTVTAINAGGEATGEFTDPFEFTQPPSAPENAGVA